ncbi:MarR family winged helix-turn-helix transcriptional regulator [Arthrobacter sp. STN4]|uniref:MarR family winged helix-turn-helix transcriptional regulator n=1 Tax=Arthrobacter sp. STN4 TaxID=2923276 RepID=UPI002119D9BF|nr:MarR family winged helix-turn-helix transcriptional regulator [Arthrobacter sp. STN4]MCQ9163204.1 MarR family winged helix-turn-helix transcriptional regulator [Arthrobacter sp. STN4]
MAEELEIKGGPDAAVAAVRAVVRVSRLLERSLSELSLPHYRILAALSAGEEIASRVAARLALGRPAVSAAVAALAGRGLLVRVDVAGDQRAAALQLTGEGWAALARADGSMAAALREIADASGHPEQLLDTMGLLNDAVSRVYAGHRKTAVPAAKPAPAGKPAPARNPARAGKPAPAAKAAP